MKNVFFFITVFLISSSLPGQDKVSFLDEFLNASELKPNNEIKKYSQYNFSSIWLEDDENHVLGIIGNENQRIRIRLISVIKNPKNSNEYFVVGKSKVKDNVCTFKGKIIIKIVSELKHLRYGVDDEYKNKGIKNQGILIAEYEFSEDKNQKHSGLFSGEMYSKWYLDSLNNIRYDNINSHSDSYMNNAFIGHWRKHNSNESRICNWGDSRVPNATSDFDIGVGEFSPSKEYYDKGWKSYSETLFNNDPVAKEKEREKWWK